MDRMKTGSDLARKIAKLFIVVLVISLVLEIGLFNIKHWETLGNSETSVSMSEATYGSHLVYTAELENACVDSLAFDLGYSGDATVDVTISLTDSGTSADAYELPVVTYYSGGRKYLMIDAYGYVKSLTIKVDRPSTDEVSISNVGLNPQVPLTFEAKRFVLVFVILLAAWLIRPRSSLWKMRFAERGVLGRVVCAGALVIGMFFGLISFGGATDDAGASWYNTFAYNEYTELAHSFAEGKLYLNEEPPSWLAELDAQDAGEDRLLGESNVYDVSVREDLGAQTGEYCKDDAAYYNGHYYVYFGVAPVVLLYLPFYLITGMDLPNYAAMLVALVLFVVFSWLLLRELCARWFKRASVGAFVVCYAVVLCASEVVFSFARPQLYNIPVAFALMFAVLGLWLLAKGYGRKADGPSCVLLFFGALCLACIAGCRPQLLLMGAAIPWVGYKIWRRSSGRIRSAQIACLCVPVVIIAAAIMWYNTARFGSVFDFGANYNLAGNDMTLRDFSVVRGIEGIVFYLFSTPHVTTAFPFFQAFYPEVSYMSINMAEPFVMGVFIQCPLLFSIVYYLAVKRGKRGGSFWLPVAWLAFSGVVIAVFDANGAGILGRYMQDCGVFFGLATCLVLLDVDAQGGLGGLARALASTLAVVMVMFTITARLSLMTPESIPTGPRLSTEMVKDAQPLFEFWK